MGVHGLTTYLRANTAAIAQPLHFTAHSAKTAHTTFVIDAWSFIYETLALLDLPWVYGGEYRQFSSAVHKIVQAWLDLGLHLHFVFDGPFPALKFPTLISRATSNIIKPSLLFFRTSAPSRSKPKFLRESSMLPPRAYAACVQTLQDLQQSISQNQQGSVLELHFADEEGDPYAVELAGRLGGYVVGKDSDFVILNTDGYKGYIPLDEILWTSLVEDDDTTAASSSSVLSTSEWGANDNDDDNDGFQTVVNPKSKHKSKRKTASSRHPPTGTSPTRVESGYGILPPSPTTSPTSLELTATAYTPTALAAHLSIPLSLLPLLAALVGNDFTSTTTTSTTTTDDQHTPSGASTSGHTNLQWLFFERQLTLAQRITRVAGTLRDILRVAVSVSVPASASSGGGAGTGMGGKVRVGVKRGSREKNRVSSVMELIERAVSALIVRNVDGMASGEMERVVERVVEATLQYAIPRWEGQGGEGGRLGRLGKGEVCALHEVGKCPFVLSRQLTGSVSVSVDEEEEGGSVSGYSNENGDAEEGDAERQGQRQGQRQRHLTQARALYLSSYRTGHLDPHTLDVLHTGTFRYRQFLENPDLEAVARAFGRPVQVWTYAILDEVFGVPGGGGGGGLGEEGGRGKDEDEDEDEDGEGDQEEDEEDEDELIDVVEEFDSDSDCDTDVEDPLAPLKGALQQLNQNNPLASVSGSSHAHQGKHAQTWMEKTKKPKPRKVVQEYVRRGTRLAVETVEVPSLSSLLSPHLSLLSHLSHSTLPLPLPLPLQPQRNRLHALLLAIATPPEHVQAVAGLLGTLRAEERVPVVVVRGVVGRACDRARGSGGGGGGGGSGGGGGNGGRERERERWTREEGWAFLGAFSFPGGTNQPEQQQDGKGEEENERDGGEDEGGDVPISDRNVQLCAQVLVTMDAVERLAECLFLTSPLPTSPPSSPDPHSTTTTTTTAADYERDEDDDDDEAAICLPSPARYFSGKRFHALLSTPSSTPPNPLNPSIQSNQARMWEAATFGLEGAFAESSGARKKRRKEEKGRGASGVAGGGKKAVVGGLGKFGLLAGLDVE